MPELAIDPEIEGIYASGHEVPRNLGAIDGGNSRSVPHST
jgi:hypothetical protein